MMQRGRWRGGGRRRGGLCSARAPRSKMDWFCGIVRPCVEYKPTRISRHCHQSRRSAHPKISSQHHSWLVAQQQHKPCQNFQLSTLYLPSASHLLSAEDAFAPLPSPPYLLSLPEIPSSNRPRLFTGRQSTWTPKAILLRLHVRQDRQLRSKATASTERKPWSLEQGFAPLFSVLFCSVQCSFDGLNA